jgi:GTPase SAR1 family protein
MGARLAKKRFAEARKADEALQRELEAAHLAESKVQKLLLLGTGESGKTTLFNQFTLSVTQGFSDREKKSYAENIQKNVVDYLVELCRAAQSRGIEFDEKSREFAEELEQARIKSRFCYEIPDFAEKSLLFWNQESIQELWKQRSTIQVPECLEYFMFRLEDLIKQSFDPLDKDILMLRDRTTGMIERDLKIGNHVFRLIDVGGQRCERKKWVKYFSGVSAVLFTVAISEYDQMVWEDPTTNRVHEALKLFKEIALNEAFSKSAIIMFLNKEDLFKEKLPLVPLNVCFPEYTGSSEFEQASAFVKEKFLSELPKDLNVFVFFTCATDGSKSKTLFSAIRKTVLKNMMASDDLT